MSHTLATKPKVKDAAQVSKQQPQPGTMPSFWATDTPFLQRQASCACGGGCPRCQSLSPPYIQRYSESTSKRLDILPASVNQVLVNPGKPLEPQLQQDMEAAFGYDLSQVRIHTNPLAEQAAQAVRAQAFTAGQNIVFNRGRFSPETREGRRLLSHELTHVIQQSRGGMPPSFSTHATHELEAKTVADSVINGQHPTVRGATGFGIYRNGDPESESDRPSALTPEELIEDHVFGPRVHEEVGDLRIRITKLEKQLKANPNDTALQAKVTKLRQELSVLEGKTLPSRSTNITVPGHGNINTRAAIQIVDKDGKLIALERGRWKPDQHAEEDAIAKLRVRLGTAKLPPGSKIIVGGNQVVCSGTCEPALEKFAKDYEAESVEAYVRVRPKVKGSGMASGKTTERTLLRVDVPRPRLCPPKNIYTISPTPLGGSGQGGKASRFPKTPLQAPGPKKLSLRPRSRTSLPVSTKRGSSSGVSMRGVAAEGLAVAVGIILDIVISHYMRKYFAGKSKKMRSD